MSGGTDTVTQTSGVPEFVRPYAERFLGQTGQVADLPYTPYQGNTAAQLNPYQTAGLDATAARAMQGSPVINAASGELQKTLGGDYLSQGNPYLTQMIDRAQGDVTRNYNNVIRPQQDALVARSGSFGNSGVQSAINEQTRGLGETLAGISTQLRGSDYAAERGRMQNAVSQAPTIAGQDYVDANALLGAGGQYQAQEQKNLQDQYGRFQEAQNYPYKQLETLGKGLGLNYGTTSSATQPGANPWAQALGGAATAYGLYGGGKTSTTGGGK